MGLRHGAKQYFDEDEALDAAIIKCLELAAQRVKSNPDYAIDKIHEAGDLLRRKRKHRDERLPDMLQKAAPPLERQIEELRRIVEAQAERLDRLEQPNVIKLRQQG